MNNLYWKIRNSKFVSQMLKKEEGVDGILVTVGLCVIALVLCVVVKKSMSTFVETIVTSMKTEATTILTNGVK